MTIKIEHVQTPNIIMNMSSRSSLKSSLRIIAVILMSLCTFHNVDSFLLGSYDNGVWKLQSSIHKRTFKSEMNAHFDAAQRFEELSVHELLFNTHKEKADKYTGTLQRLQAVFDLVPPNSSVADIGTDHALLPIALYLSGKCPKVIGVDCCEPPLEVARQNIKKYLETEQTLEWHCSKNIKMGLMSAKQKGNEIEARLGDGTSPLLPGEVDTLTIMGLGKNSIIKILSESKRNLGINTLILQPVNARMNDLARMREWLHQNHWKIEHESIIISADRFYITMLCKSIQNTKMITHPISLEEKLIGKFWLQKCSLNLTDNKTEDYLFLKFLHHQLVWQKHVTKKKIENNANYKNDADKLNALEVAYSRICDIQNDTKQ